MKKPKSPNRIGKIRRSQVVTTYGPGSIIDFRAPGSGAPISGVLAGLEEWDRAAFGRSGLLHPQTIHEPRLERRLHVGGFRQPPVRLDDDDAGALDILPVVRFPEWLQCPGCSRLQKADDWNSEPGCAERWCAKCSLEGVRTFAVPVRFIVACEDGHLDEFPWRIWIGCQCAGSRLEVRTEGPGLAGKVVLCGTDGCGARRSMEGAFHKEALTMRGLRCQAREPWLPPAAKSPCSKDPRVLQRGATNVYWGVGDSALDIPPFASDLSDQFGLHWSAFSQSDPVDWPALITILKLPAKMSKPADVILAQLETWRRALDGDDPKEPIEWAEYLKFEQAAETAIVMKEFQAEPVPVALEIAPLVSTVVLGKRLREVRALKGFTRIHPPGGMFRAKAQEKATLSRTDLGWLPGIALRGEGIFLKFDGQSLAGWESRPEVVAHVEAFGERLLGSLLADARTEEARDEIEQKFAAWSATAARFLLIHTFSHALMRRLSLECGYGSSALRERLYIGAAPRDMAAVLIHTGTPDSEGTLGGLVRQGRTDRLYETIVGALRENSWCSSDPVCITGTMTLSSPRNGAACHACLLVPETSCQHFNTMLDRALLVGTGDEPTLGYFRPFLDEYG